LPYGEPDDRRDVARQRDLPMLIAAYRLLAEVVRGLDRPVRVGAWEHPWSRTFRTSQAGYVSRVRLPAAAVLFCEPSACSQIHRLLLVPDVGTAPLSSYSTALRRLLELRQEANVDERDEPLLVVGVATAARSSGVRSEAWRSWLNQIARRAGARPLRADVLVCGGGLVSARCEDRRSPSQADEVFALIARHPLLTSQQLATLLDTSSARVAQLVSRLVDSGWLRPLLLDRLLMHGTHGLTGRQLCRLGLVELTAAGRREAARRLLVHAGLARRRHGILQDDAARRRFLRHLQHTLGTNAVFVALASAAWRVRARGGDDALEEWRAAAACARGRFRPDGYGC